MQSGIKGLKELLEWGVLELGHLELREARRNAEWLLLDATGLEKSRLLSDPDMPVEKPLAERFRSLIELRKQHVPVAYIIGKAHFWNEELEINQHCLVPRRETELIIEKFIEQGGFSKDDAVELLDIGTGSGAIGIAILREFPNARMTFLDVSREALAVAKRNAEHYGVLDRAEILVSDIFSACQRRTWQVILSNPPYLSEEDWEKVEPELRHEPQNALVDGGDGYHFYNHIIEEAPRFLEPGGLLMLETGMGQAARVARMMERNHFCDIRIDKDYSQIDRLVTGRR